MSDLIIKEDLLNKAKRWIYKDSEWGAYCSVISCLERVWLIVLSGLAPKGSDLSVIPAQAGI